MANPDYSEDTDYIRRYGDTAPDVTPPDVAPAPTAPTTVPYPRLFNPTSENALIGNVNAAARSTTLPGVGAPGSTPITDQTNLNIAAAMERADLASRTAPAPIPTVAGTAMDEYAQARQGIDQQRREIMAKLGIIKPQDAGFSAVVMANPRDRHQLLENLGVLEDQSNRMLREHHYAAIENARQTHEDLTRQTHIQTATGLSKLFTGINDANQKFGVGTAEARKAILGLAASRDPDITAALGNKNAVTLLKPYTDLHDVSAERIKAAREAFKAATGQEPSGVEITATGGINLRTAPGGKEATVPAKTMADYTTLKAARAEKQAYLDKETYAPNADILRKDIGIIDAQLGAVEDQFPQLKPNRATGGNTPAAAPNSTPSLVPPPAQRKVDATYLTPKGNLKWTGTGWVNP